MMFAKGGSQMFLVQERPTPMSEVEIKRLNIMLPKDLHTSLKRAALDADVNMADIVRASALLYVEDPTFRERVNARVRQIQEK